MYLHIPSFKISVLTTVVVDNNQPRWCLINEVREGIKLTTIVEYIDFIILDLYITHTHTHKTTYYWHKVSQRWLIDWLNWLIKIETTCFFSWLTTILLLCGYISYMYSILARQVWRRGGKEGGASILIITTSIAGPETSCRNSSYFMTTTTKKKRRGGIFHQLIVMVITNDNDNKDSLDCYTK